MQTVPEIIALALSSCVMIGYIHMGVTLWYTIRGDEITLKNYKRHACQDTCMCGDNVHTHGWGDNHAAVSEWEYYVENFKPTLRG